MLGLAGQALSVQGCLHLRGLLHPQLVVDPVGRALPVVPHSPGFKVFTSNSPKETAMMVVSRYRPNVRAPSEPKRLTSPIPATPLMMLKSTKGTATNFSILMKIFPKGSIQSRLNRLQPMKLLSRAHATPAAIPMRMRT